MTVNLSITKRSNMAPKTGISLPISEIQALDDVLQKTTQHVSTLIKIDGCSIALFDAEHETFVTLATFPPKTTASLHTALLENHDIVGWLAEHRTALNINDARHDPRLKYLKPAYSGTVVFVPLIDRDNLIGILTVYRAELEAFSPHELHVLTIFAEQAVLTIINAYQADLVSKETTQMKSHFISMVTHELRSPLNSINGYLDLILEGMVGELKPQQREFVQRARAGSENLYALIEDLLLISRADAGQLRLHFDLISLPEIVANAIEELELIALDNEIALRVEIVNDFPQIPADAVRMQQVVRNLINNALRFTPAGGSVIISARAINTPKETFEHQKQIEILIRDTGFGIAPDYQEHIFERFYQIPNANASRVGGLGLGLAIVKLIVELHGGHILVESMPTAGSTFKITLPVSQEK